MQRMLEYQRVFNDLRSKINDNTYTVDSLLPPEPELEKIYGVSRTTVRRAIHMLKMSGYVRVRQGNGTKVLPQQKTLDAVPLCKFHNVEIIENIVIPPNLGQKITILSIDIVRPPKEVANTLEVPENTSVYCLRRVSSIITESGNNPMGLMTTYLKCEPIPGFENYEGDFYTLYPFLEEKYNLFFESGKEYVSATLAKESDAHLLNVDPGSPLIYMKRISRFTNIGLMEYLITKLRPDIYQFCVNMVGPPGEMLQQFK